MNNLREYFTHSTCITLVDAEERQRDFQQSMKEIGFEVPFFKAHRDKDASKGTFDNYIAIFKAFKGDHLLIFEDDARFRSELQSEVVEEACKELIQYLNEKNDWDILQLGWCVGSVPKIAGSCVFHTKPVCGFSHLHQAKCLCSHANVYSRKFIDRFLSSVHSTYNGTSFDVALHANGLDTSSLIVIPSLFRQDWCLGASTPWSNRACRFDRLVGLERVQDAMVNQSRSIRSWSYMVLMAIHWLIVLIQAIPFISNEVPILLFSILFNALIVYLWYVYGTCILVPLEEYLNPEPERSYSDITKSVSKILRVDVKTAGKILTIMPIINITVACIKIYRLTV